MYRKIAYFIIAPIIIYSVSADKGTEAKPDPGFSLVLKDYSEHKFASFLNRTTYITNFSADSTELGEANYLLGFYYYHNEEDISKSLRSLKRALNYLRGKKDRRLLCKVQILLGDIYFWKSDYMTAETLFFKALDTAVKDNLTLEQFKCEVFLGVISKINGDYDNALGYFIRAKEKVNSKEVSSTVTAPLQTCVSNIANIHLEKGELKKAEQGYLEVIRSCSFKDFEIYAKALDNLADVYRREKKFSDAFSILSRTATMRLIRKRPDGTDNNFYIRSKCFLDSGDLWNATQAAKSGFNLCLKKPQIKASFLEILMLADSQNASTYASQYIKISDSLQLAERRNRNKFARIAFETDEIAREKDAAVKQKKMAIVTGSGLLVCSLLLLVIKIQRSRQKELLHTQQQQRTDRAIYDLVNDHRVQLDKTRQQEKDRIARELHDGVMNRLSSTRLNLYMLKRRRDDETIERCIRLIDDLQGVEKELRQVAHDLSEDIFSGNKSFNLLLESLIDEHRSLTHAQFHVEIDEQINWELCESAVKINVYRILQEVLQNIRKYAQARNIFVTLTEMDGDLKMALYDDGVGFVTGKKTKGIGHKNIVSRVESLNGTIKILSAPGQGVAFNISIPLKKA